MHHLGTPPGRNGHLDVFLLSQSSGIMDPAFLWGHNGVHMPLGTHDSPGLDATKTVFPDVKALLPTACRGVAHDLVDLRLADYGLISLTLDDGAERFVRV